MIDDAAIERRCVAVLRGADRGDHTALSAAPADDRRSATVSMVAALGWMYLDLERAVVEVESVVALRGPAGAVTAAPGQTGAALPLLASVVRMLFHLARTRKSPLEARLAALVPALDQHHQALEARGARHLCVPAAEDERVDDGHAAGPDVAQSALLVQADTDLADIAMHSGCETRQMISRRTHVAQAIADQLWRPEQALFAARPSDAARTEGRAALPRLTTSHDAAGAGVGTTPDPDVQQRASGLLPLWCGAALRRQAQELVERHLVEGGTFWARHPVATCPPGAGVRRMEPLLNWLLVRGLLRYGFEAQARAVNDALLERVTALGCQKDFSADGDEAPGAGAGTTITAALALDLVKTPYHHCRW
jgi:hypothetical protein